MLGVPTIVKLTAGDVPELAWIVTGTIPGPVSAMDGTAPVQKFVPAVVVLSPTPLKKIVTEPAEVKLLVFTVRVNPALPAAAKMGLMEPMTGV
jgi:hypothetical protein